MSVRSAAYSRDAIHPFRQQGNSMLVQSTCNTTKQPKVRRHLEEICSSVDTLEEDDQDRLVLPALLEREI